MYKRFKTSEFDSPSGSSLNNIKEIITDIERHGFDVEAVNSIPQDAICEIILYFVKQRNYFVISKMTKIVKLELTIRKCINLCINQNDFNLLQYFIDIIPNRHDAFRTIAIKKILK